MARKKTAAATENAAAAETAAESVAMPETKSEASSYVVTWKAQAGKTVKGLNGVLMSFDGEGKAIVDAVNAKRLLKIKGVEIIEG